ncbi:MAG: hypothetical protein II744_07260 [Eubacterium sp.]|nr:hypothetical protein [Eubacterium sp.]
MNIAVITDSTIQYSYQGCEITVFNSDFKADIETMVSYDAAFLVHPYSENASRRWCAHPHLRCVESLDALTEEINYLFKGIECEIKLLIRLPDNSFFRKYGGVESEIEQVYLKGDNESHRIRKRKTGDTVRYIETVKIRINPAVSKEYENRISEYEYKKLLEEQDETKHAINKKRYCFLYKGQFFELDIYDFWDDRATLELELKSIDEKYELPPEIEVIKDVTNDKRYKNNKLAGIKYEDYKTELL